MYLSIDLSLYTYLSTYHLSPIYYLLNYLLACCYYVTNLSLVYLPVGLSVYHLSLTCLSIHQPFMYLPSIQGYRNRVFGKDPKTMPEIYEFSCVTWHISDLLSLISP